MANQTGRPIAPARKLVAAVMGTLAVFVIVYGLGMSSWPVALFGVAVLVLAVVLALVNVQRRGGRATVAGNAEVKSIPPAPVSAAYGRADIEVIVVAPGLGTFDTVLRESRIPVAKWPAVGATVPITVDVDDTRRVRVNWNDAPLRDEGADPPPPVPQGTYQEPEERDDDLLGDIGPAPWEGRERDWEFEGDEEPPPPPAPRAAYSAGPTTPVVVRDTPAGTIVEGQVVGADDEPPPLPRRAAGAAFASEPAGDPGPGFDGPPPPPPPSPSFSAASAPFSGTASATRPPGVRPSPRPRGGGATATATVEREEQTIEHDEQAVERDEPSVERDEQAAQYDGLTAEPGARVERDEQAIHQEQQPTEPEQQTQTAAAAGMPPAQRTSAESTPETDPEPPIDIPLEEPADTPRTSSGRTQFFTQPGDSGVPHTSSTLAAGSAPVPEPDGFAARPEPVPSSTASEPSPVAPPPVAPTPDRPFPTAPPPETATGPAAPPPEVDDIDIPLDDNPEPAPETTPAAAPAMAAGVVAPPADDIAERSAPTDGIPAAGAPAEEPSPRTQKEVPGNPWGDFGGRQEPDEHAADVITAYPSARPGPAGAIHGVGITVLVTDLAQSTAFYREVLGFYEIDSGEDSAVLASGDTRLVLRTVHSLAAEAGRLIYLNLEVGDVEAVYEELRAKGVKFVHTPRPVNRGDKLELWSATFRDPDNHNIAITQWRAVR
ncbi:VOC family protein [Actinoplanes missouriensis]|uniref:VOC family protein n=1 Tax=Actinoplanes missouriensis TaxID=1866 RepID=UPI0033F3859F